MAKVISAEPKGAVFNQQMFKKIYVTMFSGQQSESEKLYELDPVGLTVRYEVMKLFTGSV